MGVGMDVGGFVGAFLGWLGEELKAHFVCVITECARVVILFALIKYHTYCQLQVQILLWLSAWLRI